MISELINAESLSEFLIPSEKEFNRVIKKMEKNEVLDCNDLICLARLECCHHILIHANVIQKERGRVEVYDKE